MMTQEDEQNDSKPILNNNTKAQQSLLNKYDEHNVLIHTNRVNEHPSRSFRYLQEITGEQQSGTNRTGIFK